MPAGAGGSAHLRQSRAVVFLNRLRKCKPQGPCLLVDRAGISLALTIKRQCISRRGHSRKPSSVPGHDDNPHSNCGRRFGSHSRKPDFPQRSANLTSIRWLPPSRMKRDRLSALGSLAPRPEAALMKSELLTRTGEQAGNRKVTYHPDDSEFREACRIITIVGICAPRILSIWEQTEDWVPCGDRLYRSHMRRVEHGGSETVCRDRRRQGGTGRVHRVRRRGLFSG